VTWLDSLPILDRIHEQERDAWRKRAMLEFPLEEAESWVRDFGLEMQEEERAAIMRIAAYVRDELSGPTTGERVPEESPIRDVSEVSDEVEERIDRIARSRARLRRAVVSGWPLEARGEEPHSHCEP
jgi:hypothetical protein